MTNADWTKEFPGAITVLDAEGIVLEMNDRSAATFATDGGRDLIERARLTATRSLHAPNFGSCFRRRRPTSIPSKKPVSKS